MTAELELSDTKRELVLAAEKLFATQGIAATTIRQINAAAGQKNQSAIHYHFGSREAVLDALIEMRTTPANRLRTELLADCRARAGGRPLSTHEMVHILIEPNVRRLLDPSPPNYAARLMLQLRVDLEMWRRYEQLGPAESLEEIHAELRRARPFLPTAVVRSRFRLANNMSLISLAEIEYAQERLGPRFSRDEAEFRIADMRAAMCAVIDAPVSADAVFAMQASPKIIDVD
ncbi:MAG: helix-turn-helix domain-containing protein [Albimonas sp.]|uniref:helix-turn-helix domain-containing protein n=1 Tax=Albimonas sp. TaxID=1872425 RepID=UPI004055D620